MKYIVINGISNSPKGWADNLYQYIDCNPSDVIEVVLQDNIKRTWLDKLSHGIASWLNQSNDIFQSDSDLARYFCDKRLRDSIIDEVVMAMHLCSEPFTLVGYSLGSIIAIDAIATTFIQDVLCTNLITLGSPYGDPDVHRLTKKPRTSNLPWLNIWSSKDERSTHIEVQGMKVTNIASNNGPLLESYLDVARPFMKADRKVVQ